MKKIKYFIMWLFGFCPNCGNWFVYPKKYRRHTAYLDDRSNWGIACKNCQKEDYENMEDMWRSLY